MKIIKACGASEKNFKKFKNLKLRFHFEFIFKRKIKHSLILYMSILQQNDPKLFNKVRLEYTTKDNKVDHCMARMFEAFERIKVKINRVVLSFSFSLISVNLKLALLLRIWFYPSLDYRLPNANVTATITIEQL